MNMKYAAAALPKVAAPRRQTVTTEADSDPEPQAGEHHDSPVSTIRTRAIKLITVRSSHLVFVLGWAVTTTLAAILALHTTLAPADAKSIALAASTIPWLIAYLASRQASIINIYDGDDVKLKIKPEDTER